MIDLFVREKTSSICLGYERKKVYIRKISRNMFRATNPFWSGHYTFSDMWKTWRKETQWQQ